MFLTLAPNQLPTKCTRWFCLTPAAHESSLPVVLSPSCTLPQIFMFLTKSLIDAEPLLAWTRLAHLVSPQNLTCCLFGEKPSTWLALVISKLPRANSHSSGGASNAQALAMACSLDQSNQTLIQMWACVLGRADQNPPTDCHMNAGRAFLLAHVL